MSTKKINVWISALLAVYTMFLIWVILFKMSVSLSELETVRMINLQPFANGGAFHLREMTENLLAFVPFGLLLAMAERPKRLPVKLLCVPVFSLSLECLQYVLAVGRSDVTDLITNSVGGWLGIAVYLVLAGRITNHARLKLTLTVLLTAAIAVVVGGVVLLLLVN